MHRLEFVNFVCFKLDETFFEQKLRFLIRYKLSFDLYIFLKNIVNINISISSGLKHVHGKFF